MICPHCNTPNPELLPFGRPLDGGRAYAQTCTGCGRVLGLRPRGAGDPEICPPELTDLQVAHLRFVRWRLQAECLAQIHTSAFPDGTTPPRTAA